MESALDRFKKLPTIVEEGDGYPTWHSMFNS